MSNISTEDLGVDSNDDGGLVRNKVVAMVLTGAVPLLLGLIPWKVGRYKFAIHFFWNYDIFGCTNLLHTIKQDPLYLQVGPRWQYPSSDPCLKFPLLRRRDPFRSQLTPPPPGSQGVVRECFRRHQQFRNHQWRGRRRRWRALGRNPPLHWILSHLWGEFQLKILILEDESSIKRLNFGWALRISVHLVLKIRIKVFCRLH